MMGNIAQSSHYLYIDSEFNTAIYSISIYIYIQYILMMGNIALSSHYLYIDSELRHCNITAYQDILYIYIY